MTWAEWQKQMAQRNTRPINGPGRAMVGDHDGRALLLVDRSDRWQGRAKQVTAGEPPSAPLSTLIGSIQPFPRLPLRYNVPRTYTWLSYVLVISHVSSEVGSRVNPVLMHAGRTV